MQSSTEGLCLNSFQRTDLLRALASYLQRRFFLHWQMNVCEIFQQMHVIKRQPNKGSATDPPVSDANGPVRVQQAQPTALCDPDILLSGSYGEKVARFARCAFLPHLV